MHHLCLNSLNNVAKIFTNNSFKNVSRCYASLRSSECPGKAKVFMDPKCRAALITGGSDGIGFAAAQALLTRKARGVVLVGLDFCAGQQAVNILNCAFGKGKAIFVKANVAQRPELIDAYKQAVKEYKNVDIVVNAAGVFDDKDYQKSMHTNLTGVIESTRIGIKTLYRNRSGDGGVIVNLCGLSGLQTLAGAPMLAAAHHGVVGFSRSMGHKHHWKRTKVRVMALCVGTTNTAFYKQCCKNSLDKHFAERLKKDLKKSRRQNADVCGKAVAQLVKYAKTGSVFVCNSSNLYLVKVPKWKKNSKLVSQFL